MDNYQLENFKKVLKSCFNPIEGYSNFSDWLFEYLSYNYPNVAAYFEDQADLAAAILDLDYLYDVYFSKFGFYNKTYIITLKGRSKREIYKDLKLEDEDISYSEFVNGIKKVNVDGELEEQFTEELNLSAISDFLDNNHLVEKIKCFKGKSVGFIRGSLQHEKDFNTKLSDEDILEISRQLKLNIKKESLDEAKKIKIKYYYNGPVYKFDNIYVEEWSGDTWAVSDKQALNQLTYQFKKKYGWVADTAFHLDPECLSKDNSQKIEPQENNDEVLPEIKRCDKCGTKLSDGGYCPVCDDGDEEALTENINMLDITTPYMLRKDGRLIRCGEVHPYIKISQAASDETNLKTLESHPEFLTWFKSYVIDDSTAQLIDEFEKSTDIKEKYELMNLLNNISNQEFCRVRTSNYKVKSGGDNGEIYFRISSNGFNWFDLIWNVVAKFRTQIKNVTVVNDKQSKGGKEFDYYYDHIPVDEFLTLKGNPIIENCDNIYHNTDYNNVEKGGSMKSKKKVIEDDDLDIDWNEGDYEYCNYAFAEELFQLINSLVDKDNINENFQSKNALQYHYLKHCVGNINKKSSKTNILYDFTSINDYRTYEKTLTDKLTSDNLITIDSLGDVDEIRKSFRLFFEGNKYLLFSVFCGFNNAGKAISILLYSYSTDVTTNYGYNTISLAVISKKITKTLYPVDAHYLETKLNNIIKKYTDIKSGIKINNSTEDITLNTNLNEDIEKHDELNPLLFENDKLKEDVKEAVEKIVEEFIKELKADKIKFYLEDIVLVGSNVSYNYTKDSDLDIHLIASSDELRCPDNLYPLLYSAYRSIFNKNFDLSIKGIPAEIYVEMDKPTGKSNGIYSIYNGWLKHPVQEDIPDIDQEAFDKLFNDWEDKYFEITKNIPSEQDIDKFIEDLYDLRKESIANDGEYGLGNLVFKEFRNLGYLDNLKEIKRKQIEKELSLESINK